MTTCYSNNEEEFNEDFCSVVDLAVGNFLDDNEGFVGETDIEIFEGEKQRYTISSFLPWVSDGLTNNAYEGHDDYSDDWCDKIEKCAKEIQEIVSAALENWANLTDNQPTFYGVKNVRPLSVKVVIDKDGFWEDITP